GFERALWAVVVPGSGDWSLAQSAEGGDRVAIAVSGGLRALALGGSNARARNAAPVRQIAALRDGRVVATLRQRVMPVNQRVLDALVGKGGDGEPGRDRSPVPRLRICGR